MKKKNNEEINYAAIARKYDRDYRTVKAYYERDDGYKRKNRLYPKKTDGFEEVIKNKFIDHHAPAIAIFKILKDKYGFNGGYSTIKRYCQKLKDEETNKVTLRYETVPGYSVRSIEKRSFRWSINMERYLK